ncbi:alpha-amylase [Cellvibrio zantedeschiae]|uniref:maltose alpha-D-glucosyltransferase n=1 Tax=Cellvibrio zantedeschiae TaxID=1237077 RepID=A0ABQ3AZJ7_9GAMM|nr:maltose alpha-D-glucosyltransferase [Cellvibrio zantedeschiae]GGY71803.1 alpha-amylase [Cellvibrio zantedeschiae]
MVGKSKVKVSAQSFLHDPLWYKDAVIYQVHVKSYFDANDDGVGDFAGLIDKLDYIAKLGVNAIWLLPFYPSPMRDDGYDIAEYRDIHPAYGTMAEARRFIREAHKRNLRVITEMVINHTSDQHPWFQKARRAKKGSKARNFYVWSDTNQKYEGTRIIFSDTESSNWTWDPVAGQYFWHRFYSNQPDLNFDNPEVLKEVLSLMRFWFDIGVDGLRLDAIPYLVEREGTANENLPETHEVLKTIRAELNAHYPDRMLLAEANLWPEDIQQYFGNGDECHMAFHFPLMPRMYMAIAQEDRFPIIDILRQMPEIPQNCQWAIFLRNHDELTLEMVTDQERDYLWNYYAADKRARINLGIRRRLAPLVERDRRRIELLNSLLLSMPGTPTLYYGDEIGMGDNIFLGDRHGVRTPMQWSDDRNGGFSRADPASLIAPTIMDPLYGFQAINVEAQARDTHSLLNWTRRMLAVRKQQKAFGRGNLKMLAPANRRILAYLREYTSPEGVTEIILCVANMSRAAQAGELDLSAYAGKIPVEMIGGTSFPVITKLNYLLTLPPYGFYWFLLADDTQMPNWYVAPVERLPELRTIIIKQDLLDLLQAPARTILEQEALPGYLPKCPWFTHIGEPLNEVHLSYVVPFGEPEDFFALAEVEINREDLREGYFLPLGVIADHLAGTASQQLALTRLRQKRAVGLLTDAFTLPNFNRKVLQYLQDQRVLSLGDNGELQFIATPQLENIEEKTDTEIDLVATNEANGSVVIGGTMVLKPVRKLAEGVHPEIEISNYLSEAQFANIVPILGEVKRVDEQGKQYTLMILQAYISNQGDAWQWTQNTLERALRDRLTAGTSSMDIQYPAMDELESFAQILGTRLGEMHLLLAQESKNTRFGYVETKTKEANQWARHISDRLQQALGILQERDIKDAAGLISRKNKILALIKKLSAYAVEGVLIRIHGNLHLAQILVARSDAYFVNFEDGIIADETQLRLSPLIDVADILCSFEDAGTITLKAAQGVDTSAETNRLQQISLKYRRKTRDAFYSAYKTAATKLPHAWQADASEDAVLRLACIDNRIREVLKASYRPEWLDVPLQGLIRESEEGLKLYS